LFDTGFHTLENLEVAKLYLSVGSQIVASNQILQKRFEDSTTAKSWYFAGYRSGTQPAVPIKNVDYRNF
jgi:hypothetical protein